MGRFRVFVTAMVLLPCATACSDGTPAAAPSPSPPPSTSAKPTTSAAPTTTSKPAFSPLVSPAKVTAACPLLGASEVTDAVAGADTYVSVEQAPSKSSGATGYNCGYNTELNSPGRPSREAVHLTVPVAPRRASPLAMASGLQKECTDSATPLPGIGDAAWVCHGDDATMVALMAKSSHGETRIARLQTETKYRDEVYPLLAKLLADRL